MILAFFRKLFSSVFKLKRHENQSGPEVIIARNTYDCGHDYFPYFDFGQRLFSCRSRLGWSQADLARQLVNNWTGDFGIDQRTISRYECGEVLPEYERVCELANLLGVTPEYLLTGEEKIEIK